LSNAMIPPYHRIKIKYLKKSKRWYWIGYTK
jgi:hypothetical protein